jgi:hypothetical protein
MNTLEEHLDATLYNTAHSVRLRLALRRIHAIPPPTSVHAHPIARSPSRGCLQI